MSALLEKIETFLLYIAKPNTPYNVKLIKLTYTLCSLTPYCVKQLEINSLKSA